MGSPPFIVVEASLSWACDRSGHNTAFFWVIEPLIYSGFAKKHNNIREKGLK
jgi:hypothetical protein